MVCNHHDYVSVNVTGGKKKQSERFTGKKEENPKTGGKQNEMTAQSIAMYVKLKYSYSGGGVTLLGKVYRVIGELWVH